MWLLYILYISTVIGIFHITNLCDDNYLYVQEAPLRTTLHLYVCLSLCLPICPSVQCQPVSQEWKALESLNLTWSSPYRAEPFIVQ